MTPLSAVPPAGVARPVDGDPWSALDTFLPPAVRTELEERLWRPIERQATLEVLREDPSFFDEPGLHPAMFADHGVAHVRDVAVGLVRLVDVVDGVLLPERPPARKALVQAWGVALAYLHDVGMVDMSRVGRRTLALHAAHVAFAPEADALVEHLLSSAITWTSSSESIRSASRWTRWCVRS